MNLAPLGEPTGTAPLTAASAFTINTAALKRLYWMDRWNRFHGYARILPFDLH